MADSFFPLSHGIARVDDRLVLSGIIHVIRPACAGATLRRAYGQHKTLYNRFVRWSRLGVFDRIFAGLAGQAGEPDLLMIDAPPQGASHRGELFKKGLYPAVLAARKAA